MQSRKQKVALGIVVASALGAITANAFGYHVIGMAVGAPALLLLGWTMIGHLITLDDDMPGEWSNPEGSNRIWYTSVGEFLIKAVLFVAFLALVYLR